MSQSRECIHSTYARSVAQYHDNSTECMSCALIHLFYVVACKLEVCLFSLLHLSCFLVFTIVLFANHAFTNMGRPMHRWLHWKYHFIWEDTCIVSLGVEVVFAFKLFSCMLVCLLALLFLSLLVSFRRIVSHETMYDSWSKLGKVQEALCYYHWLAICHPTSVWRTCYF